MKKSLILSFVFATMSFAGVFAQNNSRPAPAGKPKLEQNNDKANPADARPGAETPKTRPSTNKEKVEKGDKGKHKGHEKGKGHSKNKKGKGKAKGHHKGHDHDSEGESNQGRTKDKTRNADKNGKVPVEAPKGRKPLPQSEKN